jgi:hypothetical protein
VKAHWSRKLVALGACKEAVEWAKTQPDFATAWDTCQRGDWMIWLLESLDKTYTPRLRLIAYDCARAVLHLVPAGEDRPRLAIECAERYARGEATAKELAAARAAAWAAAVAAVAAESAVAAGAAAGAAVAAGAAWAAESAWAAVAAESAVAAGAAAGAAVAAGAAQASIVRARVQASEVAL